MTSAKTILYILKNTETTNNFKKNRLDTWGGFFMCKIFQ